MPQNSTVQVDTNKHLVEELMQFNKISTYDENGLVCIRVMKGSKGGGMSTGWQKLTESELLDPAMNVGLSLEHSNLCCLDMDNLEAVVPWLLANGVDYIKDLRDKALIRHAGNPNRECLIFRLRSSDIKNYPKMVINIGVDDNGAWDEGAKEQSIGDLRCSKSQILIPPSIHPSGNPYVFEGKGVSYLESGELVLDVSEIPVLPLGVEQMWRKMTKPVVGCNGQSADSKPTGSTLGILNALENAGLGFETIAVDLLGYNTCRGGVVREGSSSGQATIKYFPNDGKWCVMSTSDPNFPTDGALPVNSEDLLICYLTNNLNTVKKSHLRKKLYRIMRKDCKTDKELEDVPYGRNIVFKECSAEHMRKAIRSCILTGSWECQLEGLENLPYLISTSVDEVHEMLKLNQRVNKSVGVQFQTVNNSNLDECLLVCLLKHAKNTTMRLFQLCELTFSKGVEFAHLVDNLGDYLFDFGGKKGETVANKSGLVKSTVKELYLAFGSRVPLGYGSSTSGDYVDYLCRVYVYVRTTDTFVSVFTGIHYTKQSLNSTYLRNEKAFADKMAAETENEPKMRSTANAMLSSTVQLVSSSVYAPGFDRVFVHEGEECVNTFQPSTMMRRCTSKIKKAKCTVDQVRPWLDLMDSIMPDKEAVDTYIWWLAHNVQHLSTKLQWAIALSGEPGIGKDTILHPISRWFGNNSGQVEGTRLHEKYQDWLLSKRFVVGQEVKSLGNTSSENRLKPILTTQEGDGSMLDLRLFGRRQDSKMLNLVAMVFHSNEKLMLDISEQDRRYYCIRSKAEPMTEEHKENYFPWYKAIDETNNGVYLSGSEKVISYLMQYDLSSKIDGRELNPNQVPPDSEYKKLMQSCSVDEDREEIFDLLTNLTEPFNTLRHWDMCEDGLPRIIPYSMVKDYCKFSHMKIKDFKNNLVVNMNYGYYKRDTNNTYPGLFVRRGENGKLLSVAEVRAVYLAVTKKAFKCQNSQCES